MWVLDFYVEVPSGILIGCPQGDRALNFGIQGGRVGAERRRRV
jgi:hypothetical protein